MAEASAHKLSYVQESVIGETPVNPTFQHLPDTRTTLALAKDTLQTERLTGNRFPSQPRTGARTVGGDIPANLSFEAYDDLISSALQGDFIDDPFDPDQDLIQTQTAKAGNTRKSFSFLREFSDLENDGDGVKRPFLLYKGCEVASWSITATANALAQSTFTIFGLDMEDPAPAAPAGTSYFDPIRTEAFDTFSGSLEIDGAAKCIVTDYNLNINNGHAARYTVGCSSSLDAMVGQSIAGGSITAYFDNMDLYNKFIQESAMSLKLTLADSRGNQLIIFLPNLRIISGTQPDVSGDGSITIPINFSAHEEATLGTHVTVQTVPAL